MACGTCRFWGGVMFTSSVRECCHPDGPHSGAFTGDADACEFWTQTRVKSSAGVNVVAPAPPATFALDGVDDDELVDDDSPME